QLARYYLNVAEELSDVFLFTYNPDGGHLQRARSELFFASQKRFGVKIIKEQSRQEVLNFQNGSGDPSDRDMGAMACEMSFQAYSDTYVRAMLFSSDRSLVPAVS